MELSVNNKNSARIVENNLDNHKDVIIKDNLDQKEIDKSNNKSNSAEKCRKIFENNNLKTTKHEQILTNNHSIKESSLDNNYNSQNAIDCVQKNMSNEKKDNIHD